MTGYKLLQNVDSFAGSRSFSFAWAMWGRKLVLRVQQLKRNVRVSDLLYINYQQPVVPTKAAVVSGERRRVRMAPGNYFTTTRTCLVPTMSTSKIPQRNRKKHANSWLNGLKIRTTLHFCYTSFKRWQSTRHLSALWSALPNQQDNMQPSESWHPRRATCIHVCVFRLSYISDICANKIFALNHVHFQYWTIL